MLTLHFHNVSESIKIDSSHISKSDNFVVPIQAIEKSASKVTDYELEVRSWIPGKGTDLSLHSPVQIGSRKHPAFYRMGTASSFPKDKAVTLTDTSHILSL